MTFATLFLALCTALAAAAPLYDHAWTVDTSEPRTEVITIGQGEAVTLKASFSTDGVPLELPTGTVCTLYWQTQSMSNLWWSAPGTVSGHALVAEWSPTNDVGEARYNVFLAADKSGDKIYQAAALIKMRTTPGYTPNTLPLPVQVLDFAQLQVLNPPWPTNAATRAELAAVSNSLDNAKLENSKFGIELEIGPLGGLLVRQTGTYNETHYAYDGIRGPAGTFTQTFQPVSGLIAVIDEDTDALKTPNADYLPETWVFTLTNGTTVTKSVLAGDAQ